jgi:hypothetical protein
MNEDLCLTAFYNDLLTSHSAPADREKLLSMPSLLSTFLENESNRKYSIALRAMKTAYLDQIALAIPNADKPGSIKRKILITKARVIKSLNFTKHEAVRIREYI